MSPRSPRTSLGAALLAGALALLGACSGPGLRRDPAGAGPAGPTGPQAATARPLRVDATRSATGMDAALSPEDLVAKVHGLMGAKRYASARLLVRRFPDVTVRALATAYDPSRPAVMFMARVHDGQTGRLGSIEGWEKFLTQRATCELCKACDTRCEQAYTCLKEGNLPCACEQTRHCCQTCPPEAGVMLPELHRWQGVAELLSERPREAAAAFRAGAAAARFSPFERAHLLLMASEADRRAGSTGEARAAWMDAVALGISLAARDPDLPDPAFWERAANLKPADADWPPEAAERLAGRASDGSPADARASRALAPEALVWATAAEQRLARDEAQAALMGFSRAESVTHVETLRGRFRIGQARALIRLGEPLRAQEILGALAVSADDRVATPAIAVWGALELRVGHEEQGLAMLQKAVAAESSLAGHERLEAESNYALALLMTGADAEGLRRLHAVQRGFESSAKVEAWIRALQNELRYLETLPDALHAAEQLRDRIDAAEAG